LPEKTKIRFSMNLGDQFCSYEEVFTLEELGYDDSKGEVDTFLNKKWKLWAMDNLDGGFDKDV